jgi:hemerythrin-like domain-containing protein
MEWKILRGWNAGDGGPHGFIDPISFALRRRHMSSDPRDERRHFLLTVGLVGAGWMASCSLPESAEAQEKKSKGGPQKKDKKDEEDVDATEDLMREHGVLNRVLLVYDYFIHRIDQKQDLKPEYVTGAANIIRQFVEDYHERQEEQFLFPRFQKAGVLTDLVPVLKAQHEAGRKLTDQTLSLANSRSADDRAKLAQVLRQFVRMYRPHEAREDTVLFPAVRKIVSPHEFDALGEQFEANEHKQFGADGFEMYRDKVAEMEKQLGIYELSQFTPKV